MVSRQFYVEFGKVLYALAIADGVISEKEKNAVIDLVKKKLAPLEDVPDKFGTDLAYYAEFAFETEEDSFDSKEDALASFNMYLKVSHVKLPKQVKDACLDILNTLAKTSGNRISAEEQNIIKSFEKSVLVA